MLLSKGILVNRGKTCFLLNKNGEHCEMISAAECVIPSADNITRYTSKYNSRFSEGTYRSYDGRFKAHVRTRFLSPRITYTVNLVFKFYLTKKNLSKPALLALKYKLEGETKSSILYLADGREDGWMMVELFQFASDTRIFDVKICFEGIEYSFTSFLQVKGIEFRPLEKWFTLAKNGKKCLMLSARVALDYYLDQDLKKWLLILTGKSVLSAK
ncbi:hypothetical protein L6452_32041 [Arctium lappa]|uniref:Uncharacterized protein n=1 Tax=Arctium lappa TaxID=4217 RepID=A0ACB8Z7Q0_ARCLA|nr:hypothetical protein L6452_32041 [Arctium lappa]